MNIPHGQVTELPQCMPDECKTKDVIQAYKNYYINYKKEFATWKNRQVPIWYDKGLKELNDANLSH